MIVPFLTSDVPTQPVPPLRHLLMRENGPALCGTRTDPLGLPMPAPKAGRYCRECIRLAEARGVW